MRREGRATRVSSLGRRGRRRHRPAATGVRASARGAHRQEQEGASGRATHTHTQAALLFDTTHRTRPKRGAAPNATHATPCSRARVTPGLLIDRQTRALSSPLAVSSRARALAPSNAPSTNQAVRHDPVVNRGARRARALCFFVTAQVSRQEGERAPSLSPASRSNNNQHHGARDDPPQGRRAR